MVAVWVEEVSVDTPNINSEMPVKTSSEKPAAPIAPAQELATDKVRKVQKIDPMAALNDLAKAVDVLNEAMTKDPVALRFSIDETLNRPVVTVISEETGKVLHQLPQEEVLRAVKNIDLMRGVLFEDKG